MQGTLQDKVFKFVTIIEKVKNAQGNLLILLDTSSEPPSAELPEMGTNKKTR